MDKLKENLDEFNDLESSYIEIQEIIQGIADNPILIFSNNKAYYLTFKIDELIYLLIQEREAISNRMVSLKQSMAKELSKPENKQLKLI